MTLKGTLPESPWDSYLHFFFKVCTYFIYLFLALLGLCCYEDFAPVVASSGYFLMWCKGCSLWWLLLLWRATPGHADFSSCGTWAQQCGSWALEHRLSGCGTQA